MRIHSITQVLAFPLIIAALAILYFTWDKGGGLSIYFAVPVFLLVCLYVFHGVIDHWWLQKFPRKLEPELTEWLQKYFRPYTRFSDDELETFDHRMTLYLNGRLFQSVGSEMREVPEDIKCMVAAHGVEMSLHYKDYLIGEYDRIFLYKHPFPSPNHPYLHTVEVNKEDGVIILSLEQLANAVLYPDDYFNIGYYAYAEAFADVHKNLDLPDCENTWTRIEAVTGWTRERILAVTGHEYLNMPSVHISVYFTHRDRYRAEMPEMAAQWDKIFRPQV